MKISSFIIDAYFDKYIKHQISLRIVFLSLVKSIGVVKYIKETTDKKEI